MSWCESSEDESYTGAASVSSLCDAIRERVRALNGGLVPVGECSGTHLCWAGQLRLALPIFAPTTHYISQLLFVISNDVFFFPSISINRTNRDANSLHQQMP